MDSIYARAAAARDFIARQTSLRPVVGLILGSGLGGFAEHVSSAASAAYEAIPGFPRSTVEGHQGRLLVGMLEGVPVAVMQGRVHGYEGYSAQQVTFPVRVLGLLGITTLIVTNAAGGINESYRQGDLVIISDHINFTGANPLVGPNEERLGQRFFDMTEAYSRRLRRMGAEAFLEAGSAPTEGVYLGLNGPSFETPAEIRAFRSWGADLVGMSTVHEVIVARHMGIEVLGISCVTNMAAGVLDQPLDHNEVIATGARVQGRLTELLKRLVPRLGPERG